MWGQPYLKTRDAVDVILDRNFGLARLSTAQLPEIARHYTETSYTVSLKNGRDFTLVLIHGEEVKFNTGYVTACLFDVVFDLPCRKEDLERIERRLTRASPRLVPRDGQDRLGLGYYTRLPRGTGSHAFSFVLSSWLAEMQFAVRALIAG